MRSELNESDRVQNLKLYKLGFQCVRIESLNYFLN